MYTYAFQLNVIWINKPKTNEIHETLITCLILWLFCRVFFCKFPNRVVPSILLSTPYSIFSSFLPFSSSFSSFYPFFNRFRLRYRFKTFHIFLNGFSLYPLNWKLSKVSKAFISNHWEPLSILVISISFQFSVSKKVKDSQTFFKSFQTFHLRRFSNLIRKYFLKLNFTHIDFSKSYNSFHTF